MNLLFVFSEIAERLSFFCDNLPGRVVLQDARVFFDYIEK